MKLRAEKGLKKYADTEEWLNAVYENNKELIDKRLMPAIQNSDNLKGKSPRELFKANVTEYINGRDNKPGVSPTKALDKFVNSTSFLPTKNRLAENALKGLKSSTMTNEKGKEITKYQYFRELTKDEKTHKYKKIDLDKFIYEGDGVYIYGTIKITIDNSPYNIFVERITQ